MPDEPKLPDERLFTGFADAHIYSTNHEVRQEHLLEQYKLYVEMADKISERRQSANSYFLSVNSALLAFVGYLTTKETTEYLWLLGVAGMILSYLWYRLVRSYRDLNTAKFLVVHAIEQQLPLSPYDAEWEAMGCGKNPKLYKPVSHIEGGVPLAFVGLHGFVFLHGIPWSAVLGWFR